MKKYIEYLYMGIIKPRVETFEALNDEPSEVVLKKDSVGFRFYEKNEKGKKINYSNWYLDGERISLEEIIEKNVYDPRYSYIVKNMILSDIKYVCKTKKLNFIPMSEEDITLDEYNNPKELVL